MAVIATIPQNTYNPGTLGPFTANMPENLQTSWTIIFTKGSLWPGSGDVFSVIVEESNNGGTSWRFSASINMGGGDWLNEDRTVSNTARWVTSPLFRGVNCQIRVTINVFQSFNASATVNA
jgi:hypothetical protein